MFEIYPNRDALLYVDSYGLDGIRNMFRGTIRYRGWCRTLRSLAQLGVLDDTERTWDEGSTFADFLTALLPAGEGALAQRLADHLGVGERVVEFQPGLLRGFEPGLHVPASVQCVIQLVGEAAHDVEHAVGLVGEIAGVGGIALQDDVTLLKLAGLDGDLLELTDSLGQLLVFLFGVIGSGERFAGRELGGFEVALELRELGIEFVDAS